MWVLVYSKLIKPKLSDFFYFEWYIFIIFIPSHTKSGGVLVYPLNHLSVCLSIRPSVSASFPDSNLSSFWPIFFKLYMDIDTREEGFGIANGLNSFINNRVMALDWYKNVFFLNIVGTNKWILIKFCICVDIYKIHVASNARSFWSMALDRNQNFVCAQYLVN